MSRPSHPISRKGQERTNRRETKDGGQDRKQGRSRRGSNTGERETADESCIMILSVWQMADGFQNTLTLGHRCRHGVLAELLKTVASVLAGDLLGAS